MHTPIATTVPRRFSEGESGQFWKQSDHSGPYSVEDIVQEYVPAGTINLTDARFNIQPVSSGSPADQSSKVLDILNYAAARQLTIIVPPEKFRLATPNIAIPPGVHLEGRGTMPYFDALGQIPYKGSWFWFDHAGDGITTRSPTGGTYSRGQLRNFGTYRTQPTPGPGWAPGAFGYDIVVDNSHTLLRDLMLYNPTKGINHINGGYGRLEIENLYGQPLQIGINVDTTYDVFRASNIGFWPIWQDNADVHAYTKANLKALSLLRCDNPQILNFFTIFPAWGVWFGSSVNGITQRAQFTNIGLDACGIDAIKVDASAAGASAQFNNTYMFGADGTGVNANNGVHVNADGCLMIFDSPRISSIRERAIVNNSATSKILVNGTLIAENWNQANTAKEAVASAGGPIYLGKINPIGGLGAPLVNNINFVRSDNWITGVTSQIPTTSIGAFTTVTSVLDYKCGQDDIYHYRATITVTNNGTGSGTVIFPHMINSAAGGVGGGSELAVTGKGLVGRIPAGGNLMTIVNSADNSYPAGTGYVLHIAGAYRVASL